MRAGSRILGLLQGMDQTFHLFLGKDLPSFDRGTFADSADGQRFQSLAHGGTLRIAGCYIGYKLLDGDVLQQGGDRAYKEGAGPERLDL